jgi:hypothetical protein
MKKIMAITSIVFAAAALLFIACSSSKSSSDNGNPSTTRNYLGTQSPGDVWSWTIITDANGNGTFTATNETLTKDYSGTVSTLTNKYLKLLVTATTDTTVTVPAPVYALEVPDTVLVVKPANEDSNVIVAVALGNCPTQPATYNMVEMTMPGWSAAVNSAYSVATTTNFSGTTFDVDDQEYLLSGATYSTKKITGFSCSNGRITEPGEGMMTITPSGMVISDNGPGQGGASGMQSPAANVDLNDVLLTGREYRAVSFVNANVPGTDDVKPHWARPNGSGGLFGGDYSDFEAGIEDPATVSTITLGAQSYPGVVNGSFTESSGNTTNGVLMMNKINGKYFIYGIKEESNGMAGIFIAIEQ